MKAENTRQAQLMAEEAGFATPDEMYSQLNKLQQEIESIPPGEYTDTATLIEAIKILGTIDQQRPPTVIQTMEDFLMKRIIG